MNWTPSRIHSFITSAIRSGTQRWPPRYEVLNLAKRGKQLNPKSGKMAERYECAECKQLFLAKEVQVDHIIPIVSVEGFSSWDDVVSKAFCGVEGLQVLCKPCHRIKTNLENKERRNNKNNKAYNNEKT